MLSSQSVPTDYVERPRLTERFENGRHRKLTLVEAPLGYGKTTLIQRWMALLQADGVNVNYVSLDGIELGATRIILHGLTQLTQEARTFVPVQKSSISDNALDITSLTERLSRVQSDSCLILDDFHNADESTNRLVQMLLKYAPAELHLIIGSRQTPGFPLTKLRMASQVTDFGISDLRFDLDEAAKLLGGDLLSGEIQSLVDRAEGWVAALHMLRQFGLRSQSQPPDFDQLSEFADYLNEQYFEQLEAFQQDLLMRTAHISRLDGDVVNWLVGRDDGWFQLSRLADAHALIFVDNSGPVPSYRYHQLLRDFLKSKQHLIGHDGLQRLHSKTAEWYINHDEIFLAMRHSTLAGDHDHAARMLLEAGGVQIGMLHGAMRLAQCLGLLPSELVYKTPRLLTVQAYLFFKTGRINDAADLLENIRTMCEPSDRVLEREIILLEVHLRIYRDVPISPRQIEALDHTLNSTPTTDPLMRGILSNFLCMFLFEHGDFSKAYSAGESAMNYYRDTGAEHLQFFMHLHVSAIELEQGKIDLATERRKQAMEICSTHFSFDPSLRAIADIYLCEADLESGRTDGLIDRLQHALAHIDRNEGWNMLYLAGFESCFGLLMRNEAYEEATELLESASTLVTRRGLQLFSNQLRVMELDLAIQAGARQEADRLEKEIHKLLSTKSPERTFRWRARIRAELALARRELEFGEPQKALARLTKLEEGCQEQGLCRIHQRVLVRKLLLEVELRNGHLAEATLKKMLNLSTAQFSFTAVLRSQADFIAAAQWVITENGLGQFSDQEIKRLANLLWLATGQKSGRANILAELLTAKEFEVLRELAKGHANKVIARSLQISESTVKFHLQNIYGKIGVNSRKLAAEIANRYSSSGTL